MNYEMAQGVAFECVRYGISLLDSEARQRDLLNELEDGLFELGYDHIALPSTATWGVENFLGLYDLEYRHRADDATKEQILKVLLEAAGHDGRSRLYFDEDSIREEWQPTIDGLQELAGHRSLSKPTRLSGGSRRGKDEEGRPRWSRKGQVSYIEEREVL